MIVFLPPPDFSALTPPALIQVASRRQQIRDRAGKLVGTLYHNGRGEIVVRDSSGRKGGLITPEPAKPEMLRGGSSRVGLTLCRFFCWAGEELRRIEAMNFTTLFAILGGILGALLYFVANIRLGWIIIAIIVWSVWDHRNDGPPRRAATRYEQEATRHLKKQVEFTGFRVVGEPSRPTALTFHVTNPLKARLSDLSAICTVSRQNGDGTVLRFTGTTSIGSQSSASVSLEIDDFTYYSTERELWLDLSTVACDPEFTVDEVDLIKAGYIKPFGAEQEIAGLSEIRIRPEFRFGAKYNKYDKFKGRVVVSVSITNNSRHVIRSAWVGCDVSGADRLSSAWVDLFIEPGTSDIFKKELSEVSINGYIDQPQGQVSNCRIKDFNG